MWIRHAVVRNLRTLFKPSRRTADRSRRGEPRRFASTESGNGAYPRAGGGTRARPAPLTPTQGLSPRRRGNQPRRSCPGRRRRPIPAQAGEPICGTVARGPSRAYPRAGGGTTFRNCTSRMTEGLSPRRRGNRIRSAQGIAREGPIPAQAGEPRSCTTFSRPTKAYPRAGGGTAVMTPPPSSSGGLSPRRRGNRSTMTEWCTWRRPIPAQAGEPCRIRRRRGVRWAYPRAGGGTGEFGFRGDAGQGLSPRRRGNR